jgi:thymidylate synthase
MITANNIDSIYYKLMLEILDKGKYVDDKGGYHELIGESYKLTNPRARILQNKVRKVSLTFMIAECIWILSGHNDLEMISKYAPAWKNFSDDGETLHGAYGVRLRNWHGLDQIANIESYLRKLPLTRQAVLTIFDPRLDLVQSTKDIPCNTTLQFFIRDQKLSLVVYVRSQDMILGLPYDMFHWTILQEYLACRLGVKLGDYITHYGSVHIYKRDIELAKNIINGLPDTHHAMPPMSLNGKNDDIFNKLWYVENHLRCKQNSLNTFNAWWTEWVWILGMKWQPEKYKKYKEQLQKAYLEVMK